MFHGELCDLAEVIRRADSGKEAPSDPLQIGDDIYLDLDELSRTFNHSCEPNAFVRGKSELVALREIQTGEEITYDYATTMHDDIERILAAGREVWSCLCVCGSSHCRGRIDQFTTLPDQVRRGYIKNRLMPDFMLNIFAPQS